MRKTVLFVLIAALALISTSVFAGGSGETTYPSKPITVIVPWGAGGLSDTRARVIIPYLEEELGQPIVVKNIGGASGTVGTEEGLRAAADGYTLISVDDATWYGIYSGIGDYTLEDFTPIAMLGSWPLIIAVQYEAPWNNMQDFLADAAAKPGQLKFAVTQGNQSHLIPVRIQQESKTQLNFVAPQGDMNRNAALLAGHVDAAITYVASGKQYLEAKKFKLLGITSAERHPELPDVPTLKEQGIDVVYEMWGGFAAPAGVPDDVVKRLEDALEAISQNEELKEKLDAITITETFMGGRQMLRYLKETNKLIAEFAKEIQ
jgi:tripartite-type tricarboxylate transporter receptor subunit TctC